MKLGKTEDQKIAAKKAKECTKKVFAWLPVKCWDTERYVWLEAVTKRVVYSKNWDTLYTFYYEIEK